MPSAIEPKIIYESPDGGKTVFARIGNHRQQIPVEQHVLDSWRAQVYKMMAETDDHNLWLEIIRAAKQDDDLRHILDQAKTLYLLKKATE